MSLNENANLDTSQVEDLRGKRGGGSGFPLSVPGLGGKGGMSLIGLVVVCLVGMLCSGTGGSNLLPSLSELGGLGGTEPSTDPETPLGETCAAENPDRFDDTACRNLLYINSIQAYWQRALPERFGVPYQQTTTRYFSGAVTTGCGNASSGAGPFYCPADNHVYLDLTFYGELAEQFGARGEFAQAYVLAHEYGHHVQTLLGVEGQMRRAQQRDPGNTNAYSVMLELQADCLAGAWAHGAASTTDASGRPLFEAVTEQDVREALEAAAAVGDDTIQQRATGRVNPEQFTHGTSQQRQQWFSTGYSRGDPRQCNTFGNALA